MLERRYKLIVRSRKGKPDTSELYDVRKDPAEKQNLLASEPAVVRSMQRKLRAWQQSVLQSLTGADYR